MPVRADWPNTNDTKYVQLPDTSRLGYNVLAAQHVVVGTAPGAADHIGR